MYKVLLKDKKQTNKQLGTLIWSVDAEYLKILEAVTSHLKHLYVCIDWLMDWLIWVTLTVAVTWPVYYLFFVDEKISVRSAVFEASLLNTALDIDKCLFSFLVFVSFRKRNDTGIKEAEKKRSGCQEILSKLQQQYQQFLTKAAAKA